MSFLKKLFTKKETEIPQPQPVVEEKKNPDNTQLLYLLDIYSSNPNSETYGAVMEEIMSGNAFLLLTSREKENTEYGWHTAQEGETLEFNCVFDVEGLSVLAVFTDETALLEWAKRPMHYIALPTGNVIDFCQQNNIDRVVINSDRKNMFVMERDRSHITTRQVEEPTQVLIGVPAKPLPVSVIEKLKANFSRIESIEECYQFWQQMGQESSIVLGIRTSSQTENSRIALQNAVSNALLGAELEVPLDVMTLNDDLLKTVQQIPGSQFYKREYKQ